MRKRFGNILLLLVAFQVVQTNICIAQEFKAEFTVPLGNINLSDPFIFADNTDNTYYMYGSGGNGTVMARASKDLKMWTDRFVVYKVAADDWAGPKAPTWAAEVHKYNGK